MLHVRGYVVSVSRRSHTPLAPHHPPSATVSFTAHDDQPIILLEDFDYLLHRVSCPPNLDGAHSNVMHLDFVDPSALEATVDQWESLRQFAVISSHMGCNAEDERGAWMYVCA